MLELDKRRKLTKEQIAQIPELLKTMTQAEICHMWGLNRSTLQRYTNPKVRERDNLIHQKKYWSDEDYHQKRLEYLREYHQRRRVPKLH